MEIVSELSMYPWIQPSCYVVRNYRPVEDSAQNHAKCPLDEEQFSMMLQQSSENSSIDTPLQEDEVYAVGMTHKTH